MECASPTSPTCTVTTASHLPKIISSKATWKGHSECVVGANEGPRGYSACGACVLEAREKLQCVDMGTREYVM